MRLLRERPDQVVRLLWLGTFPFALAGIVTGFAPLITACGVVIAFVGFLMATNRHGVLDRLSERYRDSRSFRLQGKTRVTRFEGGICLFIGSAG